MQVDARLSIIEGQVQAIRRMVRDGRSGEEVVSQINSARGALKRVSDMAIESELRSWTVAAGGGNGRADQGVDRILEALRRFEG